MGTRSLTHIYETAESTTPFVTIYRQYDGYPSGLGEEIKSAIGSRKLVNGYNDAKTQCNGIGCAAAMLIGALKKGECGNVYIQPYRADDREEYAYRLFPDGETFRFVVEDGDVKIYDGPIRDFNSEKIEA